MTPRVRVRVTDPRLAEWGLPRYQTDWAAGLDLHACTDGPLDLEPQAPAVLIPSGIAVSMDDPHLAAVVLPRSGLGHRQGLVLGNGTGLIDPDYTATILISAWNRNPPGSAPIRIAPGDRIAQLVFLPVVRPRLELVDDFGAGTARGGGGFGSTGVGSQGRA